jgi:flagellar hook-length control protein FliK
MRIGEALERLLSPQEADDDRQARGMDTADGFRAHMDAAVSRERARRAPRAEDHAAAIVLDPRLVLSLQAPQEASPPESIEARDASIVERDASSSDATQRSTPSQQTNQDEARVATETGAVESEQGPSDAEDTAATRAEPMHAPSESEIEAAEVVNESAASPARELGDVVKIGFERAPLSAGRALPSVLASNGGAHASLDAVDSIGDSEAASVQAVESTDARVMNARVPNAARVTPADASVTLGPRATEKSVTLDDPPSPNAPESVAVPLDGSNASARDFNASSDDQRDPLRDEALAAGIEASGTISRGGASAPASASFATMLPDETRAVAGAARPHITGSLLRESPAPPHVANPPVDRDAVLSLLSERLASALRTGQREVIVRLSPPDLGTLRMRFSFDEQRLSARVEVSDPAVHRALEAGVADLRGALIRHDVELRSLTFAALEHDKQPDGRSQSDTRSDTRNEHDRRTSEGRRASTTTTPAIRRAWNRSTGLDITA